jgi:hypothetical protein
VVFKNCFVTILFLLLNLSCGKSANDKEDELQQVDLNEGTYSATLSPVNAKVTTKVNGHVQLQRYGDQFSVNVQLKNAPSGFHKQQLHTGASCPDRSHDINGDGYIDMNEARRALGEIIIPFDDDLSAYHLGNGFTPSGSYRYSRSASYFLMLSDLEMDETELVFENKVVSILGSSPVGEIPIACGVLKKIADNPSENQWEEEIPRTRKPSPRTEPSRPRPRPEPDISPEPNSPDNISWWERMRQRFRNWRDRARDWWNGSNER